MMTIRMPPESPPNRPISRLLASASGRRFPGAPSYGRLLFVGVLFVAGPSLAVALGLIALGVSAPGPRWLGLLGLPVLTVVLAIRLRRRASYPLRSLANLLEALREGDFSLRARAWDERDPLGEVTREVNLLSSTLREQRLGALEATALLRRVMEEIDVAVFAFDEEQRVRLVNRAAERLVAQPAERVVGQLAADLGLAEALEGEPSRSFRGVFPGDPESGGPTGSAGSSGGPWALRRSTFREGGRPLQLLVLADLSRALRQEERGVWQRIIRVLGHELNNSLTPVKSMAATLISLLDKDPRPDDWESDVRRGLRVISERSEGLARFVGAYGQLARLPKPSKTSVDVGPWIDRVAALETRLTVRVVAGPPLTLAADPDQLDQLLINLVRNAADAALSSRPPGGVAVGWAASAERGLEVWIDDEGPGISNPGNLFVPFFTTKQGGSGIGLALSRQIAEGHDGTLHLENRSAAAGCRAVLRLPLNP
jgi:two-component system, NtrC family, nitrogen regulation sensor histidine kinase NtrY